MNRNLFFITLLTALALVVAAPKNFPVNLSFLGQNVSFTISSPELHLTKPFIFDRDLNLKLGLDLQGGTEVTLAADMAAIDEASRQDALDSAREVISRRVDLYGVSEPIIKTIVTGSDYRIAVALPGVDSPDEALSLIGQTAHLEFRELPQDATDSATYADFITTNLSGSDLKKSDVQFDPQTGKPVVGMEFSQEGGDKFSAITERNVGQPLAIFLDGFPISSPIVQQKIEGGKAVINGEFTVAEAKNLAITLNAGALPVPITIIKQQNVAPSLGDKSVELSIRAGLIGLMCVALFMILLYGSLGFIADLGLVIYGLLTLALYKLIPVTITLPGLAGFILSIGMAVDANILIFERMKEELRKGNSWSNSLELGFGRAWDSIKDANIATLITTFVLFNPLDWNFLNTSGLVRGFALTLFLGVVISLFTGIFVTRNLLRTFTNHKPQAMSHKPFSIYHPMKYRVLYFAISLAVIIPGVYSLVTHGLKLGIDFTGGSTFVWQSDNLEENRLREVLSAKQVELQEITHYNDTWDITTSPLSHETYQAILSDLGDPAPVELEFNSVGPSVGRELVNKTLAGIALAATLILLYVAYRFRDLKFGVSAILAMLHDSLILLGTFSLLGHFMGVEVDTLFVTALLTILSFSVHDTIVVYDRIRELTKKHGYLDFEDIVNRAVVETMGRSINNSMTIIFMLLAMYLLGGDTTRYFILALLVGTVSGTYSSTFTAAPLLLVWDKLSRKK